jgi:hypothetical protein
MAVYGPVRHQKYIIWTEASEQGKTDGGPIYFLYYVL